MSDRVLAWLGILVLAGLIAGGAVWRNRVTMSQIDEEAKNAQAAGYHFQPISELIEQIRHAEEDRYAAAQSFRALVFAADPASVEPLAALLNEPRQIRQWPSIIRTLGHIGDPRSIGIVATYYFDPNPQISTAAAHSTIAILGWNDTQHFEKCLGALREWTGSRLAPGSVDCARLQGEPPVPWDSLMKKATPAVRSAVARTVRRMCPDGSVKNERIPPLPEAISGPMVSILESPGTAAQARQTALNALGDLGEDGVEALGQVLEKAPDAGDRRQAIALLARRPWVALENQGGPTSMAPDFILARLRALARGFKSPDGKCQPEAASGFARLIREHAPRVAYIGTGYQRRRYLAGLKELEERLTRLPEPDRACVKDALAALK